MLEVKVGQKYKRTYGSYMGHVAEVTEVDEDYVYYKPGLYDAQGNWTVYNFLRDWVPVEDVEEPVEEEVEPLKFEDLKVGQLVIRKSDGWQRYITGVDGEDITHFYGLYGGGSYNTSTLPASDFLAKFRLPSIEEVELFKEDNPDLFEEPEEEDAVNHPSHYNSDPSGVECIEITRHRNFNIGAAFKYLWRAGLKEDSSLDNLEKEIQDLEKAVFHIKDEIKRKRGE